jgi:hypothetical protein
MSYIVILMGFTAISPSIGYGSTTHCLWATKKKMHKTFYASMTTDIPDVYWNENQALTCHGPPIMLTDASSGLYVSNSRQE